MCLYDPIFWALNIFKKCLQPFFSFSVSSFYWGGGKGGLKVEKVVLKAF